MSLNSANKAPKEMYKAKTFFDVDMKVKVPDVMYNMNSFHETEDQEKVGDINSQDPLSALEQRQDAILAKLGNLRSTLDRLAGQYSASDTEEPAGTGEQTRAPQTTTSHAAQKVHAVVDNPLENGIHDVVISADPAHPPLSLFVLYELLKRQFRVLATSYIHSSVTEVDPRLVATISTGSQVVRGSHQVALSVIWKKVEDGPCLMISPSKQSIVTGEVNVARYINRLLCPEFESEDIVMATEVDEWLDIAHCQLVNGNTKEKAAALRNLNSRLGRNDWLVGSSISLADIVTWSALHQSQQVGGAPGNVKKWLTACADSPLFQTALSLL